MGTAQRIAATSGALATITWGAANLAIYLPLTIYGPTPVKKMFWGNGSTATSNMDVGIYTKDGTRIVSTGSTAQSVASSIQMVTMSPDIVLPPGAYYLAIACSGTISRGAGATVSSQSRGKSIGLLQQTTALPLPAAATFATFAQGAIPLVGFTSYDVTI